jgi:hypothetical protein
MTDQMEANNLDSALRAQGARTPDTIKRMFDVNPAVGGPIVKDKLWFFGSYRYIETNDQPPSTFSAVNPTSFSMTAADRDYGRPVDNPLTTQNRTGRLTWGITPRMRAAFFADDNPRCYCGNGASSTVAYEATTTYNLTKNRIFQSTWNWTKSDRVLIEAGWTARPEFYLFNLRAGVSPDVISVTDSGTGYTYRSPTNRLGHESSNYNGIVTASYVTGASHLKVGTQWFNGHRNEFNGTNQSQTYTFTNGVPTAVNLVAGPTINADALALNLGLFVQEQYTRRRLTLNLGLRFDYDHGYIPAQSLPGSNTFGGMTLTPAFVGPRSFPEVQNLPNWKDINPRLGFAYDLFGTGKTVVKGTVGRYVEGQAVGIAEVVNPMLDPAATKTSRSWTDANGNFVPDCDLSNPLQNGECGANSNANFGQSRTASTYAPGTVTGWKTRGYNWEYSAGAQHEVTSGLSVDGSFHRRRNGNFRVTDNLLVGPGDYDPFCVTSPVNGQLPGGGGQQTCGLYNLSPAKFGLNQNSIALSGNYGQQTQIYTGADAVANARLPHGIQFQGGVSVGRIETNQCFVVDSPQQLRFCDVKAPFQPQLKVMGIFPLPWYGLQTSVAVQSLPGPQILATWAAPAAAVTGLDRPLSGGARTVNVDLVAPGTLYGSRLNQVDFRGSKIFKVGRTRLEAMFDLYNLLNANPVLTQNNTYGANWQQPLTILPGRLAKFGFRLTY